MRAVRLRGYAASTGQPSHAVTRYVAGPKGRPSRSSPKASEGWRRGWDSFPAQHANINNLAYFRRARNRRTAQNLSTRDGIGTIEARLIAGP